jgi:hypothetical protein
VARKARQSEAVQALNAPPPKPRCTDCEADAIVRYEGRNLCEPHYVAASTRGAPAAMARAGLDRKPNESIDAWRKRVLTWLKQNVRRMQAQQDAAA